MSTANIGDKVTYFSSKGYAKPAILTLLDAETGAASLFVYSTHTGKNYLREGVRSVATLDAKVTNAWGPATADWSTDYVGPAKSDDEDEDA